MPGSVEQGNIGQQGPAEPVWLTVLTPVLNAARYMEGCLENVAEQQTPGVEQIVMDGESTDGTLEIARRYAETHPWVRVISERDGSQAAAMNHGISLARGSVISFLNADDYYAPGALKRIAGIFKGLPDPAFVVGNCNTRDAQENIVVVNRPSRMSLLDLMKGREHPWNPSAYFYHKSLHDKAGLYDVKDHYVMDLDFILRAVQAAQVQYYDEVWGNFRWIEGAKTFGDAKAGLMDERCEAVRRKYLHCLTAKQRLQLVGFKWSRKWVRPGYMKLKGMLGK
jgi:glycosyltransferase involved in cell wall biosynthesis